jgi:hypothetical protein
LVLAVSQPNQPVSGPSHANLPNFFEYHCQKCIKKFAYRLRIVAESALHCALPVENRKNKFLQLTEVC